MYGNRLIVTSFVFVMCMSNRYHIVYEIILDFKVILDEWTVTFD